MITEQDIIDRDEKIIVPIYFYKADGKVIIDEEGIRDEFERQLKEILEL